MKDLWPEITVHDYKGELGNLATRLHRPVLQDLANVISLMSNTKDSELDVVQKVLQVMFSEATFPPMEPLSQSSVTHYAYLLSTYAVQLVREVLTTIDWEWGHMPESPDLDGLKKFFNVDSLDDLARAIGDKFDFLTNGIEHPWESFSVPSKKDHETVKAIAFWL